MNQLHAISQKTSQRKLESMRFESLIYFLSLYFYFFEEFFSSLVGCSSGLHVLLPLLVYFYILYKLF